jgi:hypothetical protein
MKKLFIVLALFAVTLIGITDIKAISQSRSAISAQQYYGQIWTNANAGDRQILEDGPKYFYDAGFAGTAVSSADGSLNYINYQPTQAELDAEYEYLYAFYEIGVKDKFIADNRTIEVEVGLNSVSVQELVSQASFTAYASGFADGQTQTTGSSVNALASFIPQVLGVGFGFFLQIASFEVLGVSLLSVVAMMVGLTGLLITLKVATGGR